MNKSKVIFVLLRVLDGGGVSTHCADLANELRAEGYTVVLIYGGEMGALKGQEWFINQGITIYNINFTKDVTFKNALKSLSSFGKFITLLYKYRPEIIHCHFRSMAIFAIIAKTLTNARSVLTVHLHDMPDTKVTRFLQSRFDKLIVISSEIEKEILRTGVSPEKILKIYNGADHLRYKYPDEEQKLELRLRYKFHPNKVTLIVVARLAKVKSIETIVKAIAELNKNTRHLIQCIIVGDGSQKNNLIELSRQHDLEKVVYFPGYQDPRDFYALSDIFILPSIKEGFSVSVIEAMLSGLAILRTPTSGCYDQVIENTNGYIFPFHDHKALADKIEFLVNEPRKLKSMQHASYRLAESRFTLKVMTADTIKVYDSLMNRNHALTQLAQPLQE